MEEVAGHDLIDKGSKWLVPSFASLLEKDKSQSKKSSSNLNASKLETRNSKLETNLPIRFKQRQQLINLVTACAIAADGALYFHYV